MPVTALRCRERSVSRRRPELAIVIFLLLGGALRTVQYAARVSLWHDELAIARNVEQRGIGDLITRPLDHRQVAPVGFLASVKAVTNIAGVSEAGLRFVPWLAGMLSLLLFWRVASRFASGSPLAAVVAIFAMSPALIWYGASVKQYGTDLTVSLLLVWIALRFLEHPERWVSAAASGVAGAAAILVSHPAIVTAFILGCLLLASSRGERWRRSRFSLSVLGAGWGAGALIAARSAISLLDPATSRFMHDFWRDGFPPPLSQPLDLIAWLPRQIFWVFAHFLLFFEMLPLVVLIVVPLLAVAVLGVRTLVRSSPTQTAILSAPTMAGVAAAVSGLLPFRHRVALHAIWPILVFAGAGLATVETWLRGWRPRFASAVTYFVAAPITLIVLFAARPPYDSGQETRPVIEELARRWKTGDALYVYCGARHAIAFYGPRYGLDTWTANDCNYDDPRASLREVDAFRGRSRVWYFSMLFPREDATMVRDYLRTIGREDEAISGRTVAGSGGRIIDVYRFDLSGAARPAAPR
jgi:Dolichyl-phosphate-mannose-protein mannosyltransferase